MPIRITLDIMLAKRKVRLNELAEAIGITPANLSILKTGKARAVRFSTLSALCRVLECQPGDLLVFELPSEEGDPDDEAELVPGPER
jgi:putative transcriptional regulator